MEKNNFHKLEEEDLSSNRGPSEYVGNSVKSAVKSMHLFGNIFDHFIPKMLKLIISILGGTEKNTNENISFHSSDAEPPISHSRKPKYPNKSL